MAHFPLKMCKNRCQINCKLFISVLLVQCKGYKVINMVKRCNISDLEIKNRNSTIVWSFHAPSSLEILWTVPFLIRFFILDNFATDRCQNANFSRLKVSAAPKNAQNSKFSRFFCSPADYFRHWIAFKLHFGKYQNICTGLSYTMQVEN